MIQQLCRILFILYCERTGRRVRPNVLTRRRVRTFVSERVDAFASKRTKILRNTFAYVGSERIGAFVQMC